MKIGFFNGRFQPPHIGHIKTICKLYDDYEVLIIGVADLDSNVYAAEQVKQEFEIIFKNMPKIHIVTFKGSLFDRKEFSDLPNFSEIITGNFELYNYLRSQNVKVRFYHRSLVCNIDFSGSMIREALRSA